MLGRRSLLLAALPLATTARAQSVLSPEWLGAYAGAVRFSGSIPLEDIYPPPQQPHVDLDDRAPVAVHAALRFDMDVPVVWLRIDGGPMQTTEAGETLRFAPLKDGVALMASAESRAAPRSASLTVRGDAVGTEALFAHADGGFWRRHFNLRFTPAGNEVILWVFDQNGTRARTWRGWMAKLAND
jgi:hypothetical protein